MEIHDDEEKEEEWDGKDKVEYERNKQFEKLTAETMAMRERWRKCNLPSTRHKGWKITSITLGDEFKGSYCIASQV